MNPDAADDIPTGSVVGEYRIEGKIGQGGMAEVYAAIHPVIGKRAAIKVVHRHLCHDPVAIERFVQEAQAVNRIGHSNIVDIFSIGELPDGRPYFVMEWLCDDGLDNDNDGLIDHRANSTGDPGCASPGDTSEAGTLECDDGIDNDCDGRVDFNVTTGMRDPGCTGPDDVPERGTTACDDGADNDGDSRTDFRVFSCAMISGDPQCSGPSDLNEAQ